MKNKNILISLGVVVIGIILYKLLLGLVLPIALFVSLGYVLKFLLKGSESDSVDEGSRIFTKGATSPSEENVVEIKPIEEDKAGEEDKPIEKDKASEEDKSS